MPDGAFFVGQKDQKDMINTIFAKKVKMTGFFDDRGQRVGATEVEVLPMAITDLRTKEKNGYAAVRVKTGSGGIKEIRTEEQLEPGAEIKFEEMVKPGDRVRVTGISKGEGFAGVVKRHGFKGGPRTHGQSDRERAPGSSGSTTTPGRVLKGKRRAGHMGNIKVSVSQLKVLAVDAQKRTLILTGAVPGSGNKKGQILTITKLM